MAHRLPEERRRAATLEVWLDSTAIDELRLVATRAGLTRRVTGSKPPVRRGDLSKLIQLVLKEAAEEPSSWRATLVVLRGRSKEDAPFSKGPKAKIQMRVRRSWLERIRRLAEDAGFIHDDRGNVSELIRCLLELRLDRKL